MNTAEKLRAEAALMVINLQRKEFLFEAADEFERLQEQNTFLANALTKIIEDVKQTLKNSTAQIVEIERVRALIKDTK